MKLLLLLTALLGLSTAHSFPSLSLNYTLDSQYYEQGRVQIARCLVDFARTSVVSKFDVCFMKGYATLGCYENRPSRACTHSYSGSGACLPTSKWQYDSGYRSSNLTVLENDQNWYQSYGDYEISIKGLEKNERTHCQVTVFIGFNSNDHVHYTSNPAHLSSNPIPFRETTSCNNDTTTVKISKDYDTSIYTCTVAFSNDTQYWQADFSLTTDKDGYNCAESDDYRSFHVAYGYNRARYWRRTTMIDMDHVGGNVYIAKFEAPHHEHKHVCNVHVNGKTYNYTSRAL